MTKHLAKFGPFCSSICNYFAFDAMLSAQQLKRLSEHKYSAQDNSILDALIMQTFWNKVVNLYPLWIAPNLITITGLILNITSALILSSFSPDGAQGAPFWTYFLCALTLFLYQTLDATDGKQARRTNTCSPLGELFDHGCDALSQIFVALEVNLSILLGHYPKLFLFVCIIAQSMFYCAHWQTYVSGTLTFGKFDVTEAQFTVIGLCLLTSMLGPQFWTAKIIFGVEMRLLFIFISVCLASLNILRYFRIIFTGGVGKNGSTVAGTSILYPIFPMLAVILPQIIIYSRSSADEINQHIVLYCLLFGIISAKITNKLVVAHMTKSPLTLWDSIFLGHIALGFNQYLGTIISEYYMIILCMIFCLTNFLCYCSVLCTNICSYLKIECFRIPYPGYSAATTTNRQQNIVKANGSLVDNNKHHSY